jgi:hypothetical protein
MKLAAQISEGLHRDNVRRWSVVVEDVDTGAEVCVLISESELIADSNAKQLFRLLDQIIASLDANRGADGWTSTPSSTRGVVNDALAVYFLDATIASAFVARWCAAQRIEIVDGVYRVRDRRADIPPWKRACTRRPDRHPYLSSVVGALTGTPLPIPLFPKEGNYKE